MDAGSGEQREIVRADPALRRRLLPLFLGVLVLGVALATSSRAVRAVIVLVQEAPEARTYGVLIMLAFAAPFTLLALVAAYDTIRRSARTLVSGRFPPPGMRVLRDTPIVRGRPAGLIGVLGLTLGGALVVAALMLSWVGYRIGRVLQHGCPRSASPASAGISPGTAPQPPATIGAEPADR